MRSKASRLASCQSELRMPSGTNVEDHISQSWPLRAAVKISAMPLAVLESSGTLLTTLLVVYRHASRRHVVGDCYLLPQDSYRQ